ncbi:MAG: aldo/keto reductase [Desulfatitalea sp. BRH_c12]|nr:MAG: aldo/keto reductase [Desulfatitalea sp. BRH_c12]
MQQRKIGQTDITISAIIMGTWQAGKAMWTDIDDNETQRAMRAALDGGITTFDTAEVYGNGHSERIIAKALSNVRERVVLATKVFSNHLKYEQIIEACNRSLKNLNTDYIDLYQIHWPPGTFGHPVVPMEEIMRAMVDLKTQGKIRAIGVSNFNRAQMEEASLYGPIETLQPPYSLFWRGVEGEAAPYCRERNMTLLAYSPMAQGLLTGKFGPDHKFAKGDHRSANRLLQPEHFARVQTALQQLQPIADKYSATLGQLALAWIIAQPNACAIAGARDSAQATQNAAAGDIVLSEQDLAAMDRIGRTVTDHLDENPVQWQW